MNFEQFAHARDFLYLTALFLGAGIGCILNRYRCSFNPAKNAVRFRNRTVTAGFCFFSFALAALTTAAIFSNWAIFTVNALYVPLGILTVIIVLAFRFPRAAGFPLVIVFGIFMVWMGYACLRFPVVDSTGYGQVVPERDGSIRLKFLSPAEARSSDQIKSAASLSVKPGGKDDVLEFRARCITVSKNFPLAGGVSRGSITEIWDNNEYLYGSQRQGRRQGQKIPGATVSTKLGTKAADWFISFQEIPGKLAIGELSSGAVLTILVEGSTLTFR